MSGSWREATEDDYITWDGSEQCLERLFIWWGTLYQTPKEDIVPGAIVCDFTPVTSDTGYYYSLESTTHAKAYPPGKEPPIPIKFNKTLAPVHGKEYTAEDIHNWDQIGEEVEIGDQFRYVGSGDIELWRRLA